MSDTQQSPTWWRASDGKWYPPGQYPKLEGPPNPRDLVPGRGSARRRRKPYWWVAESKSPPPPRQRPTPSRRAALWVTLIALLVVVLVASGLGGSAPRHSTTVTVANWVFGLVFLAFIGVAIRGVVRHYRPPPVPFRQRFSRPRPSRRDIAWLVLILLWTLLGACCSMHTSTGICPRRLPLTKSLPIRRQ